LRKWAEDNSVKLLHIQPGKPTQNAYVERYNRTVKHEWLDLNLFESIEHAQHLATKWLWSYNNERPHKANGGLPPRMMLKAAYPLLITSVNNGRITDRLNCTN